MKTGTAKANRFFDTVADIFSLLVSVVYFMYVTLLLVLDFGTLWLNYVMLAITFLYLAFFVIKLTTLNSVFEKKNVSRATRIILRYSKWSMKIINAVFVGLSIATAQKIGGDHVIMMIGILVVVFTFIISLTWDITWFIIRRKFRDSWVGWNKLSKSERNERVESLINGFMSRIDTLAGVDLKESLKGRSTTEKLRDEIEDLHEEREQLESHINKITQHPKRGTHEDE